MAKPFPSSAARSPAPPPQYPAEAAARIQAAFRGLLVRRSVRIVAAIEAEVDEIEASILSAAAGDDGDEGTVRSDDRERLRVDEMLMGLLFRLDLVRGVRDYRKRVIRKVIFLQDLVDSIGNQTLEPKRSDLCDDGYMYQIDDTSFEESLGNPIPMDDLNDCWVPGFKHERRFQASTRHRVEQSEVPRAETESVDCKGNVVADEYCKTGGCAAVSQVEEDLSDAGFVVVNFDECPAANSSTKSVVLEETGGVVVSDAEDVPEKVTGEVYGEEEKELAAVKALVIDLVTENDKLQQVVKDFCKKQSGMLIEVAKRVEQLEQVVDRKSENSRNMA